MKKILFLQVKSNSVGGVWFVNKTLGHKFIELGYDVELLAIRRCPGKDVTNEKMIKTTTINSKDRWEITHFSDVKLFLKQKKFINSFKLLFKFINERLKLLSDFKKARNYIKKYNPNYIISTHYQLLDAIPKKYLCKTIHEQHTSFNITKENKSNIRTFDKYKNKIKFVWLTKATCNLAKKNGYFNSNYIYNPVKFKSKNLANVVKNKKLITVTRINPNKKIDEMIEIVDSVFNKSQFDDWNFEIYGEGEIVKKYLKNIKNKDRIKYMGLTDDTLKAFKGASINLSTSLFEGLPMSILEANECGVPTISYNFGESVYETIINDSTGYIIENRDKNEFKTKLEFLMKNNDKLLEMSNSCKKFNTSFSIETIISEWEKIFDSIEKINER